MNGWCLRNVYRIDGKLVVGNDIEDAIAVYRLYSTPNKVEIKSVEQIFGDSTRVFGDAVCRETEDRKAAETIALLTEQNEELSKKYEELENSFSEMKKDYELLRNMRGIPTRLPVVLGMDVVDEEYHESEDVPNVHDLSRIMLEKALERNGGDRKKAAQELGISDRTLYRRLKQFGLM